MPTPKKKETQDDNSTQQPSDSDSNESENTSDDFELDDSTFQRSNNPKDLKKNK